MTHPTPEPDPPFVPIGTLACRLGVPERWLREEAKADRLPCMRVGRRRLYHVELVERALLERAAGREPRP